MKIGLYPGSFDPIHIGHVDIISKALHVVDQVIVCRMLNPEKESIIEPPNINNIKSLFNFNYPSFNDDQVRTMASIKTVPEVVHSHGITAVIRGLRDGADLDYERKLQYGYEDLGLNIPVLYFIADRRISHVSSTAIRNLKKFGVDYLEITRRL